LIDHEKWMRLAMNEAEQAYSEDEVPVGAIIVKDDQIIGKGHNQIERLKDPTAHAEMIAISAAANALLSRRLDNCSLYVTLEPCSMCAGAIVLARITNLVIGTMDPKTGGCGSLMNIVQDKRLNHQVNIVTGVMAVDSASMLRSFFKKLRQTIDN